MRDARASADIRACKQKLYLCYTLVDKLIRLMQVYKPSTSNCYYTFFLDNETHS